MPAFAYRAYLVDGTRETGVLDASTKQDAARKLAQQGRRSYHLAPVDGGKQHIRLPWRGALTFTRQVDLSRLFSELSVLLNAGFTVDRALSAVISEEGNRTRSQQLQSVLDLTAGGRPIAEAFASLPGITSDIAALLTSGERSGKMAFICQRLADSFEAKAKRRAAIIEALTYPAFLLVVMSGALVILATVLVPALEPIFEGSSATKPFTMTMLSALGTVFADYPFVFPLAVTIGLLVYLFLSRSAGAKALLSRWLLKIPLVGSLVKDSVIARYLETLSLLLGNGVAMTEALGLSANISTQTSLRASFAAIEDDVANGARLHNAIAKAGIFDNATTSLISLGEDANALPVVLDRAGKILQSALTRRIDTILKLLTPALTISLGLLVGSLVISVMTTILSINDLALQ
ncbi:MAG: type II secretion system F family protein [Mesorhizobium sp.]|uniref:type II secretion system F family protein n=1 Tax=Mesorhizobium sp. TaxID=1871066 RepID=UPI000FE864FE|nr:type II secretion system F family protein [Mesorhizobium sp.]RWD47032.1 MAG: type II secretion system F family protein [Mesorhizobium sp.]RWE52182.1 MAG: type II secretion system F family protein [Mesorhizobium sp.]RWF11056.1 MAG: type II secretion system F family protein [Mesorhizobium sp.]RWF20872.1 MAG: type II secretion system F family protein [Mesorhizobium sp.]